MMVIPHCVYRDLLPSEAKGTNYHIFLDAWLQIDYKIASWTVHNQMMDLL